MTFPDRKTAKKRAAAGEIFPFVFGMNFIESPLLYLVPTPVRDHLENKVWAWGLNTRISPDIAQAGIWLMLSQCHIAFSIGK